MGSGGLQPTGHPSHHQANRVPVRVRHRLASLRRVKCDEEPRPALGKLVTEPRFLTQSLTLLEDPNLFYFIFLFLEDPNLIQTCLKEPD